MGLVPEQIDLCLLSIRVRNPYSDLKKAATYELGKDLSLLDFGRKIFRSDIALFSETMVQEDMDQIISTPNVVSLFFVSIEICSKHAMHKSFLARLNATYPSLG